MAAKKSKVPDNTICLNKKAGYDFFFLEKYEAGLVLEGWEVKSLRAGKAQLRDSYVIIKGGEAFLLGSLITPLSTASTHISPEQQRTRKLLLHKQQLDTLIGAVERKGQTVVPISMYWMRGKAKLQIALAKGKKEFDKRDTEKNRDWQREKERLFKR
ncbi:SsrA-binding protein SmpB [Candidatus Albibeggiatoa sp. nov. BB20]|uniref:SsrA-binding protein SmpB n=1 Tax=Candidatus Albibeggiatoa sp. nov. BB20 TaxID=3162723 RepID=UPI0033654D31